MTLLKAEPEFQAIHRIADSLEPEIADAVKQALEALRRQLPLGKLTELLDAGALADLGRLVADLKLPDKVRDVINAGFRQAVVESGIVTGTQLGLSFKLDNPRVLDAIQNLTFDWDRTITAESQKAIKDILDRGFRTGVPPVSIADDIRDIVGLSSRDAVAVENFKQGLRDEGFSHGHIRDLAGRMRERLLDQRAIRIARTETIRAANRGQLLAWKQAEQAGLLDASVTRRVWLATEDSRTCPICAVLDGQTVGFTEPFISYEQATGFTPIPGTQDATPAFRITGTKPLKNPITDMTPPAHPACRCSVGLVFEDDE